MKPTFLRRNELVYGVVVGLELVGAAIVDLAVQTGKGAPKHPNTALEIVGLVLALAFFAILRFRNRTVTAFAAVIAAYVIGLPAVPDSIVSTRIYTFIIPVFYAVWLAIRLRRDSKKALAENPPAPKPARPTRERRTRRPEPEPTGPRASARYTPPKAKRTRPR